MGSQTSSHRPGERSRTMSVARFSKALPPLPCNRSNIIAVLDLPELPSTPQCSVCLEYEPDVEFPLITPTPGCTHRIDVCISCLRTYICKGMQNSLSFRCPSENCIGQMDVNEIQANLGGSHQQEFDRFCEMKVRYMLQSEKGLVWCRAAGCDAAQIHVGGAELPIVTCQKCGSRSCFTHESVWHEGKTCAQYTDELVAKANAVPARVLESRKSETWIKSHTKKCPGEGCGRPIQKNDGCDHMTCRKPAGCGQDFCWVCLAPYKAIREKGNKQHKSFCKYYS